MPDRDAVHPAAAAGFSAGAATYAAGRPDYPAEVKAWLREDLRLGPGRAALDSAPAWANSSPVCAASGRGFTPSSPCRRCCKG